MNNSSNPRDIRLQERLSLQLGAASRPADVESSIGQQLNGDPVIFGAKYKIKSEGKAYLLYISFDAWEAEGVSSAIIKAIELMRGNPNQWVTIPADLNPYLGELPNEALW
ncbi:hypothetical protein L2747_18795 [Shewanella marinintestina]|uniref:hypothetical protein n=1 Tax=Shewanella marinintestina TaxID=190305 RepID=UPI00200F352B|nr:hypothetical protein [Shewanella marinintestina]MCL1148055.1 hypothetical protein [Shewanella marinintestina]